MINILKFFLQFVAILWLAYYFFENREEINSLQVLQFDNVFLMLILVPLGTIIRSVELIYYVRIFKSNIRFSQSLKLTAGCTLLSYLPLNFGMFVKAQNLKKHLGVKYTHFALMQSVSILLVIIAGAIMGLIILTINWSSMLGAKNIILYLLIFSLFFSFVILFAPYNKIPFGNSKFSVLLKDFLFGVGLLKESKRKIIFLLVFPILHISIAGLLFWVAFNAINYQLYLISGLLIAIISQLLQIVNITPQNIGIREILIGFIGEITGQTFAVGLLVSSIIRVCGLIMHFLLGIPCLILLKRENAL